MAEFDYSSIDFDGLIDEVSQEKESPEFVPTTGDFISAAARQYGLDEDFFRSIDIGETGGGANLVSPTGVRGRFQLTQDTAKRFGVNREDPADAAKGAAQLVKTLKDKYDDDKEKILAAYNAGEGVVDEAQLLADAKGTDWKDEVGNTSKLDSVVSSIIRAKRKRGEKVTSFEDEKKAKIKEIQSHRNNILSSYNNFVSQSFDPNSIDYDTILNDVATEESVDKTNPSKLDLAKRTGGRLLELVANAPNFFISKKLFEATTPPLAIRKELEDPNITPERKRELEDRIAKVNEQRKATREQIIENPLVKYADKLLKETPSIQDKYGSVGGALKQGGVPALLEYMANAGIENSGNMLLFMAPGGQALGLGVIAAGSAGTKERQLQERIDAGELEIDEGMKILNSLGTGAAESIPEIFGTGALVNGFKKTFIRTAKELGKDVAEDVTRSAVKTMVVGFLKGWGVEFLDENITELSNIIVDKVTGVDTSDKPLGKQAWEYLSEVVPELAVATWTGGALAGPTALKERNAASEGNTEVTPTEQYVAEGDTPAIQKESPTTEQESTDKGQELAFPQEQETEEVSPEEQARIQTAVEAVQAEEGVEVSDDTPTTSLEPVAPLEDVTTEISPELVNKLVDEATTEETPVVEESTVETPVVEEEPDGEIPFTANDETRGKALAEKIDGIKFNGAQVGVKMGEKRIAPSLTFTLKDKGLETSILVPVDASIKDIKKKIEDKRKEYTQKQVSEEEILKAVPIKSETPKVKKTIKETPIEVNEEEDIVIPETNIVKTLRELEDVSRSDLIEKAKALNIELFGKKSKEAFKDVKRTQIENAIIEKIGTPKAKQQVINRKETISKIQKTIQPTAKREKQSTETKRGIVNKIKNEGAVEYNATEHNDLIESGAIQVLETPKGKFVTAPLSDVVSKEGVSLKEELTSNENMVEFDDDRGEFSLDSSWRKKITSKDGVKKEAKKVYSTVMKMFEVDDIQILGGSQQNPIRNSKGKVIDDFSDGSYGGFAIIDGKPVVTINTGDVNSDVFGSVIHEAIGHFGAYKAFNAMPQLEDYARDLFRRDKGSTFRTEIEQAYTKAKKGETLEEVHFQEWVAKHTEEIGTQFFNEDGTLNEQKLKEADTITARLLKKIKDILAKMFNIKPTSQEVNDMVSAIFSGVGKLTNTKADLGEASDGRQKIQSKPQSEEKRLSGKRLDRLKLETGKLLKTTKNRINKYILNHINTEPEQARLFALADKIETNERDADGEYIDSNLRKLLSLFDNNALRGDITRGFRIFNKIKRGITDKTSTSLKNLINNNISFQEDVNLWKRLTVLKEYGKRRVSIVDGVEKEGGVFGELRNKGYIQKKKFKVGVRKPEIVSFWVITEKGLERQAQLESMIDNLKGVDGEGLELLGYIEEQNNILKREKKEFQDLVESKKKEKKTKTQESATQIVNQFELDRKSKKKPSKLDPILNTPLMKKIGEVSKFLDLTTVSIEYITDKLDRFNKDGFFKKNIVEPLFQGEKESTLFKKASRAILQEKLSGIKSIEEFAELFHSGLINRLQSQKTKDIKVKKFDYTDKTGESFQITKDQRVALYRIAQSEDGLRHLLADNGGIVASRKDNKTHTLTPEILDDILQSLTNDEIAVAKALDEYFEFQAREINRVSNKDLGFDLASEAFYHPILTKKYTNTYKDTPTDVGRLQGFVRETTFNNLKRRTNASNPIMLEGAFEAVARTNNMVAEYVGMALPVKEVKRLFNDTDVQIGKTKTSLRNYLSENGKQAEVEAILRQLDIVSGTDKESGRHYQWMFSMLKFLRKAKTVGVLGYNLPVAFLQPVSFSTSFVEKSGKSTLGVSGKALSYALTHQTEMSKTLDDFIENVPILWDRVNSHFDRDIGELFSSAKAREMILGAPKTEPLSKTLLSKKAFTAEGAMSLITKNDLLTMGLIANDVKSTLEAEGIEYNTKEFWDKAEPEITRIIRKTQPTFSTLHRPFITTSEILKPFTMFTSQPIKNLMMVRTAANNIAKGFETKDSVLIEKGLKDLTLVAVVQPMFVALVREGFRGLRGKWEDDEEGFLTKWIKGFAMANLGIYPIIGGVLSELIRTGKPIDGISKSNLVVEAITTTSRFVNSTYKYTTGEKINTRNGESEEQKIWKQGMQTLATYGAAVTGPNHLIEITNTMKNFLEEGIND